MKKEKSKGKIAWYIVYGILAVGTILGFVFINDIWGPTSVFERVVSENPVVQYLYQHAIRNIFRSVQIIVIAIALWYLLLLLSKIVFHNKKAVTISKLILNFLKWVIAIATIFFILGTWGANTVFMLAGAGVVTLIIGLGSQALVADILAGIFIVFEGDFQVDDIVIVDGWRGTVKEIGVRTTKLVDAGGNVKIINNSDIRTLINQTQELSIAKCYVSTNYGERIENIEKVIADNLDKIKEKIPAIVEGPFYKGVSELGPSSVDLLFLAKCKEEDIYQVQRDLNREIKILFDDNGIGIPFPQITVSYAQNSDNSKVSNKVKKVAEEFVEEQKDLSKDIDDKK